MANSFSHQNIHSISYLHFPLQSSITLEASSLPILPFRPFKNQSSIQRKSPSFNERKSPSFRWALRIHNKERTQQISTIDFEKIQHFVQQRLPHVFNEPEIIWTLFDERMSFQDPITRFTSLHELQVYFELLKHLFHFDIQLHNVKQTGPSEITTRWTMIMTFMLFPWKPELVFTGTSIMGINPQTQRICRHVDLWDSIEKNDYFSLEGLWDVLQQLHSYKTSDLELPKYHILKRTANYEVRKYSPFVVVEIKGDKLSGSSGFNDIVGYIFGRNSSVEKIPRTTFFTQASNSDLSEVPIQIVLPVEKDLSSFLDPSQAPISLRKVEGGIVAVSTFNGKPTKEIVCEKEKALRPSLLRDGLKPKEGCLLACYNDPGWAWNVIMRNEVLLWLEDFTLE